MGEVVCRMYRLVTFVDGSNLVGVLRRMNLRVDDYEVFSLTSSTAQ